MSNESRTVAHLRVLFALIMREMNTRYGRSFGGYAWAVLDPLGFILLMSIVFSQLARMPPLGTSFPLFYATGYVAFFFYLDISSAVSGAIRFNRPLLSFPRVTLLDTLIARFVLQLLTAGLVAILLLTSFTLYAHDQVRIDPAPILQAVALSSLLGLGIASVNSTLFLYSETWQRVFGVVNRPLFILSGILFLYEDLPRVGQQVLWWNPLVHVTALMRSGFYPVYNPNFVSPSYVAIVALIALMLGILLLRVLRSDILER